MMDGLVKRSVTLDKHRTSLALEPEFWAALERTAKMRNLSLTGLLVEIDAGRGERPLASACRVFALHANGAMAAEISSAG